MADTFNYTEATKKVNNIKSLTEELGQTLTNMDNIVSENVGNESVWSGDSANSYRTKWTNFYEDNRNNFIDSFTKQSENIQLAIDAYKAWEDEQAAKNAG